MINLGKNYTQKGKYKSSKENILLGPTVVEFRCISDGVYFGGQRHVQLQN
jgi:hypothetical protein